MAPKSGPFVESINPGGAQLRTLRRYEVRILQALKTEIGEVAVAYCNTGAAHEQTVDGRHKAAEKTAGGGELDGSAVGHFGPHFSNAAGCRRDLGSI